MDNQVIKMFAYVFNNATVLYSPRLSRVLKGVDSDLPIEYRGKEINGKQEFDNISFVFNSTDTKEIEENLHAYSTTIVGGNYALTEPNDNLIESINQKTYEDLIPSFQAYYEKVNTELKKIIYPVKIIVIKTFNTEYLSDKNTYQVGGSSETVYAQKTAGAPSELSYTTPSVITRDYFIASLKNLIDQKHEDGELEKRTKLATYSDKIYIEVHEFEYGTRYRKAEITKPNGHPYAKPRYRDYPVSPKSLFSIKLSKWDIPNIRVQNMKEFQDMLENIVSQLHQIEIDNPEVPEEQED